MCFVPVLLLFVFMCTVVSAYAWLWDTETRKVCCACIILCIIVVTVKELNCLFYKTCIPEVCRRLRISFFFSFGCRLHCFNHWWITHSLQLTVSCYLFCFWLEFIEEWWRLPCILKIYICILYTHVCVLLIMMACSLT